MKESKNWLFGKELNHKSCDGMISTMDYGDILAPYHTVPTFYDPNKEGFGKQWEKKPFPTVFSTQSKTEIAIFETFNPFLNEKF